MDERRSEPREIEIKLELTPRALSAVRKDPLLRGVASRSRRLLSRYFDADGQILRRLGWSLRLRSAGERIVQTVKTPATAVGGLHNRLEWDTELRPSAAAPDLEALAHTPLARLVDVGRLGAKLKPVFEIDIERTSWPIRYGASDIELACDEGHAVAGDAKCAIAELELELKSGSLADLFALARRLVARVGGRIGVITKAERGYALLAAERADPAKADPVPLTRDLSVAEAFKVIARSGIRQFRLNQPLIEIDRDAEAVHQARIAIRRLHTALSTFKAVLAGEELDAISPRLKHIFRELGKARNLDVHLASLNKKAANETESVALVTKAARRREGAYDEMIAELASRESESLLLDLLAFVEIGGWQSRDDDHNDAPDRPIGEFAARALARRWRKFGGVKRPFGKLRTDELHRLRIHAKSLRYACEFFRGLYAKPKAARRCRVFLAALSKLQDDLGALNDLATSRKLAKKLVKANGGSRPPSITKREKRDLAQDARRAAAALRASAAKAHKALMVCKPFW